MIKPWLQALHIEDQRIALKGMPGTGAGHGPQSGIIVPADAPDPLLGPQKKGQGQKIHGAAGKYPVAPPVVEDP